MRVTLLRTSRLVMVGVILLLTNTKLSFAQNTRSDYASKPASYIAVWGEYSFPEDGFAIALPHAPRKHPDKNFTSANAYSVNINPDYAFTLRVIHDFRECRTVLAQLREGVVNRKAQETDPGSVKEMALDGHPGLEYEWKVNDQKVVLMRYYCGEGRLYALAVGREKTQPLMPEARRILDSFRLLESAAR